VWSSLAQSGQSKKAAKVSRPQRGQSRPAVRSGGSGVCSTQVGGSAAFTLGLYAALCVVSLTLLRGLTLASWQGVESDQGACELAPTA
jgi:hypothetical protein